MPFTVIPFAAYVLASQCTRPWSADFADLDTTISHPRSPNLNPTRRHHSRVMRSDDPPRDPRNTAHKHHPAPALALHSRQTQLGEQVRGAAVDAPCALEDVHGDLVGGLDARQAVGRAGVVDEDRGGSEDRNNVFVEFADLRCTSTTLPKTLRLSL
jgi:hypothetical protein